MNYIPPSRTQNLLRIVAAWLTGAVTGIAGFALWADNAGVLVAGPLFNVLFPIGLCAGLFISSLPILIGEIVSAIVRMKN